MVIKIVRIFLAIILVTVLSLSNRETAADPPPPPKADITVTDFVAPVDDHKIPFGNVAIGNTSDQTVTVANDGNINLSIGLIANANPLAAPFSILNEDCSNIILAPAGNCTITVRFDPTTTGTWTDSFDIPSDGETVTVNLSGTSGNDPPPPQLVYPSNAQTCAKTTDKFIWGKSIDPDGDTITYKLEICEDENFTTGCITKENIAFFSNKSVYFAGTGSGLLLFGIVLVGGIGDKKRLPLIIVMIIITATLFISCGSGDDDPPITTPKTTVSGTVFDGNGDPLEGAEVTILSDPVKATTDNNGVFSADVEVGSHELKIMAGSIEIYSKTITCKENEPLVMGKIETSFIPDCEYPNAPASDPNSEISYEVSGLKSGTKYYWKVVAGDGFGGTAESEVRNFTTK